MKTSREIALAIRNTIVRTARLYALRTNNPHQDLGIPEYLHNVRIYDILWLTLKGKDTIYAEDGRIAITLEEFTSIVKSSSRKKGPTAAVVSGYKKHDICVWIDDKPLCVVEVKKFGNRYDVFSEDVNRLESVVRGQYAPRFSILAFHGHWPYDRTKSKKHQQEISDTYHRHRVEFREFQLPLTKDRYLAGTITILKNLRTGTRP